MTGASDEPEAASTTSPVGLPGRIVNPDGHRLSLGTYATKRAAGTDLRPSTHRPGRRQARATIRHHNADSNHTHTAWVEARLTHGASRWPRVRDLYATQLRLHILPTLGSTPAPRG